MEHNFVSQLSERIVTTEQDTYVVSTMRATTKTTFVNVYSSPLVLYGWKKVVSSHVISCHISSHLISSLLMPSHLLISCHLMSSHVISSHLSHLIPSRVSPHFVCSQGALLTRFRTIAPSAAFTCPLGDIDTYLVVDPSTNLIVQMINGGGIDASIDFRLQPGHLVITIPYSYSLSLSLSLSSMRSWKESFFIAFSWFFLTFPCVRFSC